MTHGRAVATMVAATLMWSIAGVVTRHLEGARGFEVTFWRSAFCIAFVLLALRLSGGGAALAALRRPGRGLLLSGLMWSVMFCCFMIALTLTSTSNTLIVSSASPLLTVILARLVLRTPIPRSTWYPARRRDPGSPPGAPAGVTRGHSAGRLKRSAAASSSIRRCSSKARGRERPASSR